MKIKLIIGLLFALSFAAGAIGTESPSQSFFQFEFEQRGAIHREKDGSIGKHEFMKLADALWRHLAGAPRSFEKPIINVDPLEQKNEKEIVVYAGYDTGLAGRGCNFTFDRSFGSLKSITIVPGM